MIYVIIIVSKGLNIMKEIAVIIPIYKAHDTIKHTLCSIGMQRVVDYKCYLVVDGEEKGVYDYLRDYVHFDMEILYMDKNGGPGVAPNPQTC